MVSNLGLAGLIFGLGVGGNIQAEEVPEPPVQEEQVKKNKSETSIDELYLLVFQYKDNKTKENYSELEKRIKETRSQLYRDYELEYDKKREYLDGLYKLRKQLEECPELIPTYEQAKIRLREILGDIIAGKKTYVRSKTALSTKLLNVRKRFSKLEENSLMSQEVTELDKIIAKIKSNYEEGMKKDKKALQERMEKLAKEMEEKEKKPIAKYLAAWEFIKNTEGWQSDSGGMLNYSPLAPESKERGFLKMYHRAQGDRISRTSKGIEIIPGTILEMRIYRETEGRMAFGIFSKEGQEQEHLSFTIPEKEWTTISQTLTSDIPYNNNCRIAIWDGAFGQPGNVYIDSIRIKLPKK